MSEQIEIIVTEREANDLMYLMDYLAAVGPSALQYAPEVAAARENVRPGDLHAAAREAQRLSPVIDEYRQAVHDFGTELLGQFEANADVLIMGAESLPIRFTPETLPRIVTFFTTLAKRHTDAVTCDPDDCFAVGINSVCGKLALAAGTDLEGLVVTDTASTPTHDKLED